jgi:hypothetical protein
MHRTIRATALLGALLALAACQDRGKAPTGPSDTPERWTPRVQANIAPGTCVTLATLYAEADTVFSAGGPNANSVKSKIDQIDKANKKGDRAKAKDAAFNAVRFVLQKFREPQPLAGTPAQVARLISHIFCFAGIDITVTDPYNTRIVDPSSGTQVVTSADNTAGTSLPPNSITEPTVLEFTKLTGPQTLTRLDQYPGYFVVTASNASGSGPAAPVVVAICPDPSVPASIRGRLRLGHQKTVGFEITPVADASFLNCPVSSASASGLPGWLGKALSFVMPRTLYAAEPTFVGGVGGLASEFSPFAPIDPSLSFAGGVGGTAGEFILKPGAPGLDPNQGVTRGRAGTANVAVAPVGGSANYATGCAAVQAVWGTELPPECRPGIVVRTANGTLLRNVPVSWSVTEGGGALAPEDPVTRACGTFAATVSNASADSTSPADAARQGRAGVCWRMGPVPGSNTATATPSAGGDAPAGVTFTPASQAFTATAIKSTPSVAINCPASVVYNATAQAPCSAAATDNDHAIALGPVAVTYGPTAPLNVGTYTADASYAATVLYNSAAAPQTTFNITPATPAVTISCPASVPYTGADQTPCTGAATGIGNVPLTPVVVAYTPGIPNAPGSYTATATFAAAGNYTGGSASAGITVLAFSDGFETDLGWTRSGQWNRSTLSGITNVLIPTYVSLAPGDGSAGALPAPKTGSYAQWFGSPAWGNYLGQAAPADAALGGTSATTVTGTATSPSFAVPSSLMTIPSLEFDTWWEIESVNPSTFDIMEVAVQDVATSSVTTLGALNPGADPGTSSAALPFTSGGYNAPPVWTGVAIDLSAFRGKTVRVLLRFDSRDRLYNGFRGWVVDNVRLTSAPAAIRTAPTGGPTFGLRPVPPPTPRP